MTLAIRLFFAGCLVVFVFVHPMAAPKVYFSSGEEIFVAGHSFDGDRVVLSLVGGGEIICDASLIKKIEPAQPVLAVNTETAHFEFEDLSGSVKKIASFRPYAKFVQDAAKKHDVDPVLLHAIIEVESSYRPNAVSSKGAMGLMQLMPETAAQYKVEDPFDPRANIDAGARFIRRLLDQFGMQGGLAAYNAGPSSVLKFGGIPPYPETRRYVERVLGLIEEARNE